MKKLFIALLVLLLAAPAFGAQTVHRRLEPETVAYQSLANAVQTQFTTNENIKAIKYTSTGLTLASLTAYFSTVAGTTFVTGVSQDLRWLSSSCWSTPPTLTWSDGTNTYSLTPGAAGTGETYGDNLAALETLNLTSIWTTSGATVNDANTFTNTAATGHVIRPIATVGTLFRAALTMSVTAGAGRMGGGSSIPIYCLSGESNKYATAVNTTILLSNSAGGIGAVTDANSAVLQPVLTPSATGLWFTNGSGASFNPNATLKNLTVTR
ncbi:MAG: hypothetical protein ACYDG4_13285 [Desulfuromonadaceae bacterium]